MIWREFTDEQKEHHVLLDNSLKGLHFGGGFVGDDQCT